MRSITEIGVAAVCLVALAGPSLSAAQRPRDHQKRDNKPAAVAPKRQVPQSPREPRSNRQAPQPMRQPGRHAGQWLRDYKKLPPEQQQKALDNDPKFRSLPPQRQEQLRNRLERFNNLPPQQQQRIIRRMETWEHLTPGQKQQAREVYSQIKDLPPGRRRAMHNAINALRAMPPEARQRALESGRFSHYSPQEREMLNGISQLPLAPAETEPPPEE